MKDLKIRSMLPSKLPKLSSLTNPNRSSTRQTWQLGLIGRSTDRIPTSRLSASVGSAVFFRFGSETCCESCQKRSREKKFCDCGTVLEPKWTKMFYTKYYENAIWRLETYVQVCSNQQDSLWRVVKQWNPGGTYQYFKKLSTLSHQSKVLHQASLWMTCGLRKNDNHMDILYLPFFPQISLCYCGLKFRNVSPLHHFTRSQQDAVKAAAKTELATKA